MAGDDPRGFRQIDRIGGFDASWEIGLFGKAQRSLEATRDGAEARMELRNAVLITVIADVARNYLGVASARNGESRAGRAEAFARAAQAAWRR
jgi:outer membrane protein TolC